MFVRSQASPIGGSPAFNVEAGPELGVPPPVQWLASRRFGKNRMRETASLNESIKRRNDKAPSRSNLRNEPFFLGSPCDRKRVCGQSINLGGT